MTDVKGFRGDKKMLGFQDGSVSLLPFWTLLLEVIENFRGHVSRGVSISGRRISAEGTDPEMILDHDPPPIVRLHGANHLVSVHEFGVAKEGGGDSSRPLFRTWSNWARVPPPVIVPDE